MKKKYMGMLFLTLLITTACTQWDQRDPNMPEGLVEYHKEFLNAALEKLEENPEDFDALLEAAIRYERIGDYKNAVDYYEKVLKIDANNNVALNNLASMYEVLEKYEKAADYIKQLYVLDPTNIETIKDTVRILLEAGAVKNAQEALDNFAKKTNSTESSVLTLIQELQEKIDSYPQ